MEAQIKKNRELNPRMIEYARHTRGMTQKELAEKAGMSQGELSKIETGQLLPKESELVNLSKALSYPTSLFFSSRRILPADFVQYRKRKSIQPTQLKEIDSILNFRTAEIGVLLESVEFDVNYPHLPPRDYGKPEEIARKLRSLWRIEPGPIMNLTELLEEKGIIIFRTTFANPKLDGMYIKNWTNVPFIFINENFPPDRQRFTLAHELGHLIMHSANIPTLEEELEIEAEADRFASEFLIPADEFKIHFIDKFVNIQYLASLKPYWKVSIAAMIRKSRDCGLINQARYESLNVQMSREGYRKNEPLCGLVEETPKLITDLINVFIVDLGYSESQIAGIMDLNPDEFSSIYQGKKGRFQII